MISLTIFSDTTPPVFLAVMPLTKSQSNFCSFPCLAVAGKSYTFKVNKFRIPSNSSKTSDSLLQCNISYNIISSENQFEAFSSLQLKLKTQLKVTLLDFAFTFALNSLSRWGVKAILSRSQNDIAGACPIFLYYALDYESWIIKTLILCFIMNYQ